MSESGIFKTAAKLPPDQRAAYLDQACDGNAALRHELESLLQAHDASDSLLPDDDGMQATKHYQPVLEGAGTVIGPYKLLQQIGEGGMGIVYMAEQQVPVRRKVALKIIKPGMDSQQVIARFEAERQALAMMDHQNIAKVFDAGTTESGRPYFVMELVHGIPLTAFCDENRLTLRQRLELFIPVCHAIQHAHQKGIIHRDVKPSNVLVTMYDDRPVPKVIDFGIAKATDQQLTERTMFTHFGAMVGTFEYMSPEQAEMNAFGVDTRSDIYSLGVLLYELLTGTTPLEKARLREAAYNELVRLIKEEEPPRPSIRLSRSATVASVAAARKTEPQQLSKLVRGDLDWIVMRCLEKHRDRRYDTANGLARDIQRYLTDEPVEARPPSAGYRLQKFVRRNKGRVVAAGVVFLALVAGIVGTSMGLVAAQRARDAAEEQKNIAEGARATAEAEKNEKDQERRRADTKAAEALADKKIAVQQEAAARAEKQRADSEAKVAVEQREAAERSAAKVGSLLFSLNLKAAELEVAKSRAENQLLRSEWLLYSNQIATAEREWDNGDVALAWQHLNASRKDFRGWEYNYLYTLFTTNQRTLRGHTDVVSTVAYSPEGKQIVSASFDNTVKIWDVRSGEVIRTLKGHRASEIPGIGGGILGLALSPDGKRIASAGQDKTIRIWDAASGREILTISLESLASSVAFSPDGKYIVEGGMLGSLKVRDASSGREALALQGDTRGNCRVAFSPDGKRIASGRWDGKLKVWDAANGQELLTLQGQDVPVTGIAFSPDGKRIISGDSFGTLKVWDAVSGKENLSIEAHNEPISGVAFSPDGKRFVSSSRDKTLKLWDATNGEELLTLQGHTEAVNSVAFSPDGNQIVSGGRDKTLKLWDANTSQETLTLRGHGGVLGCVAFSPDGRRVASGDWFCHEVIVWDASTGNEQLTLEGHTGAVHSVAFSPDGKRIASGSDDKTIKVWDAASGRELLTLKGHAGPVSSVAFSPDGLRIVSGSGDKTLKLWDVKSGHEIFALTGQNSWVSRVAFSPDGKRIVSGSRETAKGWDATSGRELLTLTGHKGGVSCLAFSPDGRRIVSGGSDKTLTIWDASSGKVLLSFEGDSSGVTSVAYSPDGTRIVAGCYDNSVKLWDSTSGGQTLSLEGHTGRVRDAAFSPDGKRIASSSADGTIMLWDASRGPEAAR